jgi:hypothetical protein
MAESILDIIFRTKKTGTGEQQATSGLKNAAKAFEDLTGVNLTAAGAFTLVAAGLKKSVAAAAEAERVNAQLAAVLESTKMAAGLSADELDRMATSLMYQTAVDDELIKSAEAVMLTFTKIGEEVFPDAIMSALDMSQALGQDLQSSVIQLGKALNDPIQGVTALRRVGVSFTEDQMEMIRTLQETGDLMGAQKIVLQELSTEFGGSAAAAADTYSGKLKMLENNLDNLAASIGEAVIPILADATTTLNLLLTWTDQVNAAVEEQKSVILDTSTSYEDYIQKNIDLAKAAGKLDQNFVVLKDDTLQTAEDMRYLYQVTGMLDEEQWRAAQYAGEYAVATEGAGTAAQEAQGPVSGLANSFGAAAGEAGLAATSAHEMAGAAERLAQAESTLKTAQDELATAQENWQKGAGGQIAGMLEATGLKAEDMYLAIDAADEVMGTNEGTVIRQKDAMQKLVDEYKRTKDVDAFKQGLIDLQSTFMPLDESVKSSTLLVETLQAKLNEMARVYHVVVRTSIEGGVTPPSNDNGSNDCFLAGTPVTTPDGLRPIEQIRVGDLVSVMTSEGVVSARVSWRKISRRSDLVTVHTSDGQAITCSPNHRFMTRDLGIPWGGGWCWAKALQPGVLLVSDHGEVHVDRVEEYPGINVIFNFTIDHRDHTFLVGGIVVHNVEKKASGGDLYNGRMYMVGEEGTELLQLSPGGRRAGHVYPNEQVQAAAVGGGPLVGQVVVNNGMDVEELIYKINKRVRR